MNDTIKIAIRNAFLYLYDNNITFSPEVFFQALCKESKTLGMNFEDCEWYDIWSAKFSDEIKKELNNYPIKTRNDFINTLASIIKHRLDYQNNDIHKILQKALKALKDANIIDYDTNTPLAMIDSKLDKINISSSNISNTKERSDEVVLCSIIDKLDSTLNKKALEKLLNALCEFLKAQTSDKVSLHKNSSILIIPNTSPSHSIGLLRHILETKTFIYKSKPIHIELDFKILRLKDL